MGVSLRKVSGSDSFFAALASVNIIPYHSISFYIIPYHSISFHIIPCHSISHPPSVFVSACLLGFAAPGEVALPMLRIWHASRLPCQRTGLLDRHGAAPVTQTIVRRRGCILKPDLGHLNNTKRIQGIGVDHGTT